MMLTGFRYSVTGVVSRWVSTLRVVVPPSGRACDVMPCARCEEAGTSVFHGGAHLPVGRVLLAAARLPGDIRAPVMRPCGCRNDPIVFGHAWFRSWRQQ